MTTRIVTCSNEHCFQLILISDRECPYCGTKNPAAEEAAG